MSVAQCITGPRENEWGRGPQALMKDPTSRLEDSTSPGEHDADQGRAFPTPTIPDSITYPTRQTLKSSQIPNSLPRVAVSNFSSCPKVPSLAQTELGRSHKINCVNLKLSQLAKREVCPFQTLSLPDWSLPVWFEKLYISLDTPDVSGLLSGQHISYITSFEPVTHAANPSASHIPTWGPNT